MLSWEAHFESLHGILKQKRYWGFHPIHWGLSCVCPSCNFPVGGPLMAVSQATWMCGGSFWWPFAGRFDRTPTWDWCRSMTSMRRPENLRWTADPSTIEMSCCYAVHNWMVLMSTADRMVSQILSAEFDPMSFSRSLEGFWKLCNQDYQHGGPDFWQWNCKVYSPLLEHHRYHTLVYVVEPWELWGWSHPWICEVCTS